MGNNKESQNYFYILRPMRKELPISDAEAETLYNMWLQAPPGTSKIAEVKGNAETITTLITKGYVKNSGSALEITDKGRQIIVEMVTAAPSVLENGAKMPSYKEIKSKTAKTKDKLMKEAQKEERQPYNKAKIMEARKKANNK